MILTLAGCLGLAACGGGAEGEDGAGSRRSGASSAALVSTDSSRAATAAESLAVARDMWNKAEVVRRLEEAGLVVTDSGQKAREPALHVEGERLLVSGGELEIYV